MRQAVLAPPTQQGCSVGAHPVEGPPPEGQGEEAPPWMARHAAALHHELVPAPGHVAHGLPAGGLRPKGQRKHLPQRRSHAGRVLHPRHLHRTSAAFLPAASHPSHKGMTEIHINAHMACAHMAWLTKSGWYEYR